jgi:hypothetical protein
MTNISQSVLDDILQKDKKELLAAKIDIFDQDLALANRLNTNLSNKSVDSLTAAVKILDRVMFKEYGDLNPLALSPLYHTAIDNNAYDGFDQVVSHISLISKLYPQLFETGIQKTAPNSQSSSSSGPQPVKYKDGSYAALLYTLLKNAKTDKPIDTTLQMVEKHFGELTDKGYDVGKLVNAGYVGVIYQHIGGEKFQQENLPVYFNTLIDVLNTLQAEGFDIYKDVNLGKLQNQSSSVTGLSNLKRNLKYLNRRTEQQFFGFQLSDES